ncbi:hypothetical protein [Lentzea sp. NBRC 105346]|uniref:hypothetical protein n=1 Tax=Lentzea sp. NBRC 105346 TaxID=3032205 RepID=UPI00255518B5|nr:hypothetical protein [Lentzea sp. NBRC 105346]
MGTAMPASADPVSAPAGITAEDIAQPELATDATTVEYGSVGAADDVSIQQTAAGAVQWFRSRNGSTAYQGYCERAVRLAWDRRTHHASAIEHWNSSDGVKHRTGTPPLGAFVFWNISNYGHVGIADGHGGFWATSVNGRIGHASSTSYFRNYLGWKPGNSN